MISSGKAVLSAAKSNIGLIGASAAGAAVGGVAGFLAGRYSAKKSYSKKRKSKSRSRRQRASSYRRKHKQRQPYTARKHKDTSHRRIRFTKNNQPYIILKSGKARFIKKKSVRNSRKRSGGRY